MHIYIHTHIYIYTYIHIYVYIYDFTPFHQNVFQAWNALEISPRACVTINRLCGPLHLSELNTNRSLVPEIHIAPCIKSIPKTGVYSQGFHSIYEVEHKTPHHFLSWLLLMGAKCANNSILKVQFQAVHRKKKYMQCFLKIVADIK